MKEIKLTRGKVALVDDADFEWLNQWKWCILQSRKLYAQRSRGKGKILMHRLILNTPKELHTDHIDGDGLNNQRANLRVANRQQNGINRPQNHNNSTGYKGVTKKNDYFVAQLGFKGGNIRIGSFKTAEEAHQAYVEKAQELFGNFAHIL